MEYKSFFPLISHYDVDYLGKDFSDFLKNNGSDIIYEMADFLMMTLPSPRVSFYEDDDFNKI